MVGEDVLGEERALGSEVPRSDPGSLYATRSVLWKAVDYLSDEQRELLYDIFKGTLADFRARASESSSVFRHEILDELEKITFRLAQRAQFREGYGERSLMYLVCIRCDVIAVGHGSSLSCPSCGTATWLEAWYI